MIAGQIEDSRLGRDLERKPFEAHGFHPRSSADA